VLRQDCRCPSRATLTDLGPVEEETSDQAHQKTGCGGGRAQNKSSSRPFPHAHTRNPQNKPQSQDCARYRTVSTPERTGVVQIQASAPPRPDGTGTMLPLIWEGLASIYTTCTPRHNKLCSVQGV
jgi:hypothetical protein